jgi:hypothetical protein
VVAVAVADAADGDWVAVRADVLRAQGEGFGEAEAASMKRLGDRAEGGADPVEVRLPSAGRGVAAASAGVDGHVLRRARWFGARGLKLLAGEEKS